MAFAISCFNTEVWKSVQRKKRNLKLRIAWIRSSRTIFSPQCTGKEEKVEKGWIYPKSGRFFVSFLKASIKCVTAQLLSHGELTSGNPGCPVFKKLRCRTRQELKVYLQGHQGQPLTLHQRPLLSAHQACLCMAAVMIMLLTPCARYWTSALHSP